MNLYLLAHQTLVAQLQNSLFYLNANHTRDLWPKWYNLPTKEHSLLADRFEPLIYSFAKKLTIPIVN
jgi:hypothetical protein